MNAAVYRRAFRWSPESLRAIREQVSNETVMTTYNKCSFDFWLRQGAQGEAMSCVRVCVCACVRVSGTLCSEWL